MSTEEDTELRDLVAQTLETNGVLGKIRAQLRASVFLALEEQENSQQKNQYANKELRSFLSTKEGQTTINLIKEFLEFFNLEFTSAVLEPECGYGETYENRTDLARDLNIIESEQTKPRPLLAELVRRGAGDSRGRLGSGTESVPLSSKISNQNVSDKKPQQNGDADSTASKSSALSPTHSKEDIFENEVEEDPFFDEPLPNNKTKTFGSSDVRKETSDIRKEPSSHKPGDLNGGGMTSLSGLPPLGGTDMLTSPRGATHNDIKAIDKKLTDLGLDDAGDDYDDDFDSSNVSPFGITPRSQKSDQNVGSIQEDIEEDISEDLSLAEDILKSDNSNMDDLTTDRTVSPADQSNIFDYAEDVLVP